MGNPHNHGLALFHSGSLEAALVPFDRAHSLDPQDLDVAMLRAEIHARIERFADALRDLDKVLAIQAQHESARGVRRGLLENSDV